MSTPFISEIQLFAFNFAPKGWALCAGQLLPINQNQALFSLLGTTYGGNGQTNFALPNLQGRVAISMGPGQVQSYALGQQGGAEAVTITPSTMPAHTHAINPTGMNATIPCTSLTANQRGPAGAVPAVEASSVTATYSTAPPDASESATAIAPAFTTSPAGSDQPHTNLQPHLALNYCIALQGIFPSQT